MNAYKNHRIIYVHIPKTAGTTLNTIIERHYPPEKRFSLGPRAQEDVARFKALSAAERARIWMLNGHLAYGLHDYLPGPTAYFTILREPIDRIVSFYYFVHRNPQHYLYDFTHRTDDGLRAYLDRKVTIMVDNFQTRFVSGVWDQYPFGELPPEVLELAKANLRHKFAVVGLTERFDETLLLLSRAFGWRRILYTRQNVTADRPPKASLDADTLAALTAANQMDLALYAYGQELFAARIAAQGPLFPAQVRLFQTANRVATPLIAAYWRLRRFSLRAYLRS